MLWLDDKSYIVLFFFYLNLPILFISVLLVVGYSCCIQSETALLQIVIICVFGLIPKSLYTLPDFVFQMRNCDSWFQFPLSDWELFPLCFVVLWCYWWRNPFWCMAVVLLFVSCTWDDFIISYPRWVKGGV